MVVKPQHIILCESYSFSRKKANQSHTHHKITNSAKIEAMHTIKLQIQHKIEVKTTNSANKLIDTLFRTWLLQSVG